MPIRPAGKLLALLVPLGAVALLAALAGCVEQTLSIDSNPPGALVYLNNEEFGRTPIRKDFLWYGNYQVDVRKEGYQTLQTSSWVEAPWWNWVPLDLIAIVLPVQFHDRQHLSYTLAPTSSETIDPQAVITRAHELESQLESSPYTRAPATKPATTQKTPTPSAATKP